jgi:hypothetical protein
MAGEFESLFRVAEATLGDVKAILNANSINFAEFNRGGLGVGVGTAWGDDIVIVATVEISAEAPPAPFFYLTSGILRNADGDRLRLLEICNVFNERWVTPAAFVLDEDDGSTVLLKMLWPVMLFRHEPGYMMRVISRLAIQTPKLREQLISQGIRGDLYRATEEDMTIVFNQSLADPRLGG